MPKDNLISAVNRIIIGDVGSGKTIVAFVIALCYMQNLPKSQVALMAPTEVLAGQHAASLLELKNQNPELLNWFEVFLVAGKKYFLNGQKLTKKEFLKEKERLFESEAKIFWIGTQALLFDAEVKPDLVLVDEQHRFGVRQREVLTKNASEKQELSAHYLSFSATPIPRTLALTVYRYLQPHFLQKIATRKSIQTNVITFDKLNQTFAEIENKLLLGEKVYVICAKVEEGEEVEENEVWNVQKTYNYFESFFRGKVLQVHGRLKEKKEILQEFKDNPEKQILVATSVVEVGVDVGSATMILILNSERFGLAALHQLRGRIGRNNLENNLCILVTHPNFKYAKRLKYLVQYNDGFELAQKDLELRGAGNMLGQSQSGFDSELDQLLGLDTKSYEEISQMVDTMDLSKLPTDMQRLQKYIEQKTSEFWQE
jgi:ATP-dependent DNA helicase RecG